MRRAQLRRWMKAERGAITGLALSLDVHASAVSMWLSGKSNSTRIERAVRDWAYRQALTDAGKTLRDGLDRLKRKEAKR